ncbi:hypothetical protein [Nocardia cyriacigeorgica]|nr:hypothetical protein [Nocardia cyriacigeorgica]
MSSSRCIADAVLVGTGPARTEVRTTVAPAAVEGLEFAPDFGGAV